MADVLSSTTQSFLSAEMQIFYDKVFLERVEDSMVYDILCTKKHVPANSGKVVYFTRQTQLPSATTALTEGTNPDATGLSATTVSATLAEYGGWTKPSSLFKLTTIDAGLKEAVEGVGQQAGETIDDLLMAELFTGATAQLAGGKSALTAVATSDTLSATELRKAVRTLKQQKAKKYKGNLFKGVISTTGIFALQGDTSTGNFITAEQYKTPENIKKGHVGKLAGVEIHETDNEKTQSSTTTVYSNFIGGKEACGMVDVNGKGTRIIMKNPGKNDTSNPLEMYSTLGWKIPAFAVKTLNSNWLVDIQCGHS